MKRRRSNESDTTNKKQRKNLASDIFDDESLNNCFCNVDGITSAIGYFAGSVDMLWPNNAKKFMFNFSSRCCVTDRQTHKISVTFEGDWIEAMEAKWGPIRIMDQIQLSLDGVMHAQPKDSKRAAKLIYKEGVVFQRTRKADLCFVNTWQLREEQKERENIDWFSTPAHPVAGPLSKFARLSLGGGPNVAPIQEENITSPKQAGCQITPTNHDRDAKVKHQALFLTRDPASEQPAAVGAQTSRVCAQPAIIADTHLTAQPRPAPKSHKAGKKERKRLTAAAKAAAVQNPVNQQSMPTPVISSSTAVTPTLPQPIVPVEANHQVVRLSQLAPNITSEDNPEGWMARLRRFKNDFIMLKEATNTGSYVSMIGIVKDSKKTSLTRMGELTSTVYLQDPSLLGDGEFYPHDFSVVFFQKRFKEWLPQVTKGDILVLHNIRIQTWAGTPSGVGYNDKAQWAVFSTSQGCFIRPQTGDAPEDRELVDGGVRFTPFLHTTESEKHYCQRLSEWWEEKKKGSAESTGQVYQLSEDVFNSKRKCRQHLRFCDAGPDVDPGGYFDCTFEVLNLFQTGDQPHTLYVTDYTKNAQVAGCQAQWCPPGLNDYVLKFELWGAAAGEAQSFSPGTYWGVRNARLKRGNDGYIEGKIVEKKFNKLDPEADYPPLQELLERKREWESQNRSRQNHFAHKLLKDTQDGEYINCTVELLHVTKESRDGTYIEVTDYTAHPMLSSYRHEKEWSRDLEGFIISILLRDAQVQHANSLRPETYLTIKNLRMRDSKLAGRFQGDLGGREILIYRLNTSTRNDDLQALFDRKEKWKETKISKSMVREKPWLKAKVSELAKRPNRSIQELRAHVKETLKARVIARVIDYHPRPHQWIRPWCSQCKQRIPDGKRACHNCQDMDHEFVCWKFRLMLRIEDREGEQMDVFLGDQCELLQGLERGDCFLRPSILAGFTKRLEPLLGDPDSICREGSNEVNADYIGFIIARYEGGGLGSTCILFDVETG